VAAVKALLDEREDAMSITAGDVTQKLREVSVRGLTGQVSI